MIKIRASMLPSWHDCPRRGAAKQFRRMIAEAGFELREISRSIGAAIGTGLHSGVMPALKMKMQTGELPPVNSSIELGIIEFKKQAAEGIIYDTTTASMSEAEKQIITMVTVYNAKIAPNINLAYLPEEELKACIQSAGIAVELSGHPDIETTDLELCDVKSGTKMRPYFSQLGGYSLLRLSNGGKHPDRMRIDYVPRVSTKKMYPGIERYYYDVITCEREAWGVIKHIVMNVNKFLEVKQPWCFPANPMSMMCSDKYCPAWGTEFCKLGRT